MNKQKLFPIPLLGQETPEIESLASYIYRSSYGHGVSVGVFLKIIHERCPEYTHKLRKNVAGKAGLKILSRMSGYTESLRNALIILTGQELRCEALSFLDNQIQGIGKEMCEFRWCPECFRDMEKSETPLYFKQIWHMKAVIYCPLHRTPLISSCSHCGEEQFSFKNDYRVGECLNCGKKLTTRKTALEPIDVSNTWDCLSLDLYEIFQKVSTPGSSPKDTCNAKYFVTEVYNSEQMKFTNAKTERGQILRELLFHLVHDWSYKHSLLMLRRIAYYLNLSLHELLSCPKDKAQQIPLELNDENELPEGIRVQRRPSHNHKEEFKKITRILKRCKNPPSLKSLASSADISLGYLEYRYPELVRKVVTEHRNYQAKVKQANKNRARAAAIRFFSNSHYAHKSQSKYEAYNVLSKEENLPKWVLMHAINEAYEELIKEGGS